MTLYLLLPRPYPGINDIISRHINKGDQPLVILDNKDFSIGVDTKYNAFILSVYIEVMPWVSVEHKIPLPERSHTTYFTFIFIYIKLDPLNHITGVLYW